MDTDTKFKVFLGVWGFAGLVFFLLFKFNVDPEVRRQRIKQLNVIAPILMGLFLFWISGELRVLGVAIPLLALISYFNLHIMRVCQKCGALVQGRGPTFRVPNFCSRCGHPFEKESSEGISKPFVAAVIGFYVLLFTYGYSKKDSLFVSPRKSVEDFCASVEVGSEVVLLRPQRLSRMASSGKDSDGIYETSTFYDLGYACDVYSRNGKVFSKSLRQAPY
jgi:hypothetical protein